MRFTVAQPLRAWADLLRQAGRSFVDDDAPLLAAGLAFFTLLSLAPVLVLVLMLAAPLLGEETVRQELVSQAERFADPEIAQAVDRVLENIERPSLGSLSAVLGLVVLLYGATRVFGYVQLAINRVWGVAVVTRGNLKRSVWKVARKRLLGAAMILTLVVMLLASFLLGAALRIGARLVPDAEASRQLYQGLELAASAGLLVVLLALVFRYLPDVKVAFRDVWLGAVVTAVLFTAGRWVLSAYLSGEAMGSAFGAAGSLVLLIVWIYYSCVVFLFGAELTEAYAERKGAGIEPESYASRVRPPQPAPGDGRGADQGER
jgi:membrane protein